MSYIVHPRPKRPCLLNRPRNIVSGLNTDRLIFQLTVNNTEVRTSQIIIKYTSMSSSSRVNFKYYSVHEYENCTDLYIQKPPQPPRLQ